MMGSKGGGSKIATVQKSDPWIGVQDELNDYLARETALSRRSYTPYSGPRIAGLSPEQTASMGMTANRTMYGTPESNAAKSNLYGTISGAYLNANPYLDQIYNNAALRMADAYSTGTAAQTSALGRNSGSFGNSGVEQLRQQQNRAFGDSLANLAADIYGSNYQAERSRQMQAVGMAPVFNQMDYQNEQQLMGVGDINRDFNQALINQAYNDWYEQYHYPETQLDRYRQAVVTGMGGGGTSTSTGPNPYQQNSFANAIGSGLGLYGMGSALGLSGGLAGGLGAIGGLLTLSDKRAKTDIVKVGKTDDGLNVYTFRYKFGGPTQMGVMAQEVEKVNPDAVGHVGGLLAVDYSRIGRKK